MLYSRAKVFGIVVSTALLAVILWYLLGGTTQAGDHMNPGYELEKGWPQLPTGFVSGNPSGIGIDSKQHVIIFCRAGRKWPLLGSMPRTPISSKTIVILDRQSGKILSSWGDSLFIMPHGLTVDGQDNIWVTDVGLNQVFKFSHEGKLLMKLGVAGVAGDDSLHFNQPTDVAIANDGSFYVSDGYGNSRIVKFSAEGKYLLQWGTKGKGKGQFHIPHAITLDENGRVYVADRENCRIGVFDPEGNFLSEWKNKDFGHICSVTYDKITRTFTAVDDATSWFGLKHNGSDILVLDSAGNLLSRFGRSGGYDGPKCWYHDVAVDDSGNIYTGDILGNRIQKFRRIHK
jgi:peptidylamidoglycolate lyase